MEVLLGPATGILNVSLVGLVRQWLLLRFPALHASIKPLTYSEPGRAKPAPHILRVRSPGLAPRR